jgi:hypothetical protein
MDLPPVFCMWNKHNTPQFRSEKVDDDDDDDDDDDVNVRMNNSIISKVIAIVIRCRYDGIVDIVRSIVYIFFYN